jgi:hypothetical protein
VRSAIGKSPDLAESIMRALGEPFEIPRMILGTVNERVGRC